MVTVIRHAQQKTTQWSGGTTTELWLWPEGTSYLDRTFDIRISTATIDVPESTFSDLSGYTRYLMSLTDPITLFKDQLDPVLLEPLIPYAFDGGASMKSIGTATDFNVMVKPSLQADLKAHSIKEGDSLELDEMTFAVYVLKGIVTWVSGEQSNVLSPKDFLIAQNAASITLNSKTDATLVVVTINAETV